jgi:hypothetical protein
MGPCCKFFKVGGRGQRFWQWVLKGKLLFHSVQSFFFFCICQISPKVSKSPFLNKFFVGLYFWLNLCPLTLLSRQNAPHFNSIYLWGCILICIRDIKKNPKFFFHSHSTSSTFMLTYFNTQRLYCLWKVYHILAEYMYEDLFYNYNILKFTLNVSLVKTLLTFQGVSGTAHLKLNSTVAVHSQPLVKG